MRDFRFQSRGSILIELMISVAIGLLLLSGLTEIYLSLIRANQLQTDLLAIATDAESALTLLHQDISHAGYIGCAKLASDFPLQSHTALVLTPQTKIIGEDHRITVRYATFSSINLLESMTNPSRLIISNEIAFKAGDIVLISNCARAEIVEIATVLHHADEQILILAKPLNFLFEENAQVSEMVENTFYLCHQSALCVRDIHHQEIELVDHILALNFTYSVRQADKLLTLPVHEIVDWSQVVGVAIDMQVGKSVSKPWHDYVALR